MKIEKFEDLTFWQESIDISAEIFKILDQTKDLVFKTKICDTVITISSEIAKWFDKRFDQIEYINHLNEAISVNTSLRSILYIGKNLWYFKEDDFTKIYDKSVSVSKMIWWFIKSFKKD